MVSKCVKQEALADVLKRACAVQESAFMTLIDQLQLPAHDTTIVETDSPEPLGMKHSAPC